MTAYYDGVVTRTSGGLRKARKHSIYGLYLSLLHPPALPPSTVALRAASRFRRTAARAPLERFSFLNSLTVSVPGCPNVSLQDVATIITTAPGSRSIPPIPPPDLHAPLSLQMTFPVFRKNQNVTHSRQPGPQQQREDPKRIAQEALVKESAAERFDANLTRFSTRRRGWHGSVVRGRRAHVTRGGSGTDRLAKMTHSESDLSSPLQDSSGNTLSGPGKSRQLHTAEVRHYKHCVQGPRRQTLPTIVELCRHAKQSLPTSDPQSCADIDRHPADLGGLGVGMGLPPSSTHVDRHTGVEAFQRDEYLKTPLHNAHVRGCRQRSATCADTQARSFGQAPSQISCQGNVNHLVHAGSVSPRPPERPPRMAEFTLALNNQRLSSCKASDRVLVSTRNVTVAGHDIQVSTKACSADVPNSRPIEKRQVFDVCNNTQVVNFECVVGEGAGPLFSDCANLVQAIIIENEQPGDFCYSELTNIGTILNDDCIIDGVTGGIAFPSGVGYPRGEPSRSGLDI
ncbi:hypothetical protein B0H11DRAFT_2191128 [Mycena galericulata]|nr:hypothetical protein B0H11DRAFT_2191128 [Mycena galericulata]